MSYNVGSFMPAHKALCQYPLVNGMLIQIWNPHASSEIESIEASAQAREGAAHEYSESAAVSSSTHRLPDARPPAASAQAKFNLGPTAVKKWGSFDQDMRIREIMNGEEELLNGLVHDVVFDAYSIVGEVCRPDERFCAAIMDRKFVGPFVDYVVRTHDEFMKYRLTLFSEDAHPGFRTNWTITRSTKVGDPYDDLDVHCGIETSSSVVSRAIIVHEHKACAKFPNSLKRSTMVNNADELARELGGLDLDEVLHQEALEHVHENLEEYWNHFTTENNYSDDQIRDFRSPIVQVYVYMLRMCVRYGVLSTTDRTWFLRLEPDNNLLVSRVFKATETGENSARLAYAAFIVNALKEAKLVLTDEQREKIFTSVPSDGGKAIKDMKEWKDSYSKLTGKSSGSSSFVSSIDNAAKCTTGIGEKNATTQNTSTTSSSDDIDEFMIKKMIALQDSLPCTVAQFPYRGGLEGVVKQYPMGQYSISAHTVAHGVDYVAKVMTPKNDSRQYQMDAIASFENEMAVYEELRPLMGIYVPFYLFGGRHMFNDLLIAVSYHGDALSRLPKASITSEIKRNARAALSAVHEYGVAHNDIRLSNFVLDHIEAVRVIDFGMATIGASDKMIADDNAAFDNLFAFVE